MVDNHLRISPACNNGCSFCDSLWLRSDREKHFKDFEEELSTSEGDRIILPCNLLQRRDRINLLKMVRSTGKKVVLRMDARDYSDDIKGISGLFDEIQINMVSLDPSVHRKMIGGSLDSYIRSAKLIEKSIAEVRYRILLYRDNIDGLEPMLSNLDKDKVIIEIPDPHPILYEALSIHEGIEILDRPSEVKLELTGNCNMDCEYCFNKNSGIKSMGDMPLDMVKRIINQMVLDGIRKLKLSGGEPMLRDDIVDIVRIASGMGLSVRLNTNGSLLDSHILKGFRGLNTCFFLPVNGKEELPRFRSVASMIKDSGLRVDANSLISKGLIEDFNEISSVMRGMNIYWNLVRPVPTERSELMDKSVIGSIMDMVYAFDYHKIVIDGLPFCSYHPAMIARFSYGAITCGIFNKIVIDPQGGMKACYSISSSELNIGTDRIMDAWNQGFIKRSRYGHFIPKRCKSCNYLWDCLGGCRHAAKLYNGSYDSMDPLAEPDRYLR